MSGKQTSRHDDLYFIKIRHEFGNFKPFHFILFSVLVIDVNDGMWGHKLFPLFKSGTLEKGQDPLV